MSVVPRSIDSSVVRVRVSFVVSVNRLVSMYVCCACACACELAARPRVVVSTACCVPSRWCCVRDWIVCVQFAHLRRHRHRLLRRQLVVIVGLRPPDGSVGVGEKCRAVEYVLNGRYVGAVID